MSPRGLSVAKLFCSRWSAASHLCCLCGAVICVRVGFVGLPVWGLAWWAPMMEIVLSAAASPRLSQDSSVAGHEEKRLHPWPVPKRSPGKMFYWSSCLLVCICSVPSVMLCFRMDSQVCVFKKLNDYLNSLLTCYPLFLVWNVMYDCSMLTFCVFSAN